MDTSRYFVEALQLWEKDLVRCRDNSERARDKMNVVSESDAWSLFEGESKAFGYALKAIRSILAAAPKEETAPAPDPLRAGLERLYHRWASISRAYDGVANVPLCDVLHEIKALLDGAGKGKS